MFLFPPVLGLGAFFWCMSQTWTGSVWLIGAALHLACLPALRRPAPAKARHAAAPRR